MALPLIPTAIMSGISLLGEVSKAREIDSARDNAKKAIRLSNQQYDTAINQTKQQSFMDYYLRMLQGSASYGAVTNSATNAGISGNTLQRLQAEDALLADYDMGIMQLNERNTIVQMKLEKQISASNISANMPESYNLLSGILNIGAGAMQGMAIGNQLGLGGR